MKPHRWDFYCIHLNVTIQSQPSICFIGHILSQPMGKKRKKTKPIKFKWDPPAPPLPSPVSSVSLLKLGTFAEATMLNTNNTPFSQSSPNLTSSGRLCPFIVPGAYVWMVKKAGQKQLGAGAGIPPGGVLMLFYNNLSAAWRPPDTMAVAVFECLSVFMVGGG